MENSLLAIFNEIWSKFEATLKILKKSNVNWNQLKLDAWHKVHQNKHTVHVLDNLPFHWSKCA